MISIIKKELNFPTVFVIIVLCFFYPYVFNTFFHLGGETIFMLLFFFLVVFILNAQKKKMNSFIPASLNVVLIIQAMVWFFYFIIHADTSYLVRIFLISFSYTLLLYLVCSGVFFQFSKVYNFFITIQAVLGVPVFFLFAFGMLEPLAVSQLIDGRESYFLWLTFSNSVTGGICRIAGFFDEPGALAFWGIYSLLINKVSIDNKKIELALILSLLFTVSAAYFIQLFMYVLLFYGKKIKVLIPMAVLLCMLAIFTYSFFKDNETLISLTVERFEGGRVKTSRIGLSEDAKVIFKNNAIFGVGANKLSEIGYFDDNPYEIPAKDGMVGFIVTYLPLIMLVSGHYRDRRVLLSTIILFAGYMQRPFHVNLLHYFELYLYVLIVLCNNRFNGKSLQLS